VLNPAKLRIFGFRGFRSEAEFHFDTPLTCLFGENGSCKSSALNAIEWALFGDACIGKQTGIRERLGWIIPNRHASVPNVGVELTLSGPGGSHVVRRRLRHVPGKGSLQPELEVTLAGGTTSVGSEAEAALAQLRQGSFRDFLTTVYQHQESIRSVLTQEPKERNDAIDRLLGLAGRRDLLGALVGASLRSRYKEIGQRFAAFEEQIRVALTTRANDLAELQHEAHEAGIARDELTAASALLRARRVAESVQQFARATELANVELPVPGDWTGILEFDRAGKALIGQLRGRVPGIEEQQRLLQRQRALLALQTALDDACRRRTGLNEQAADLQKEHGSAQEIAAQIAAVDEALAAQQERLGQTNAHAAVVNEAIRFFASADAAEPPCPVCGSATPGLRGRLEQLWTEKLQGLVHEISSRINELNAERKNLHAIAESHGQVKQATEQIEETVTALRAQLAEALQRRLAVEDDAVAEVAKELQRLAGRLQEMARAIDDRQQQLDAIEHELARVRLTRNYLHVDAKRQVLAQLRHAETFQGLDSQRNKIGQFVEDVEAIKNAVAATARQEAEVKLAAAEQAIDGYFRALTRHAAVKRLTLAVSADKRTGRNAYQIGDQDGNDLTPVLSQGDLNALALAIFLGLAMAARDRSVFGCLLLDDPSQSLSTEHKKALAGLLNQVAQHKKLIVATMDAEFHEFLLASITKDKTAYRFGPWTPEGGPSIVVNRKSERAAPKRKVPGGSER
jgi:DNA repair protein SbcC/Rad50